VLSEIQCGLGDESLACERNALAIELLEVHARAFYGFDQKF